MPRNLTPAARTRRGIDVDRALRHLGALLLSTAVLLTGNGLINTLLPVRAEIEGFSTLEIGLLGTVYFAGFVLGCLNAPLLVRRVGHIRAFASLAGVVSVTALAHVLLLDPLSWGLLRLVVGFSFAGLYAVIESWLNDRADAGNRGAVMSVYTIINFSVLMLGQFLLMAYDPAGFELFAVVAILLALALVPVSLTKAQDPRRPATVGLDLGGLWRLSPVGFAGCLGVGLVNGSFWSMGPVFASRSGLDISSLVLFMAGATLAGALTQWPLGRVSDHADRRLVIAGTSACAAASGAVLGTWSDPSPAALIALSSAFGGFAMPLYAVSVAHANDQADDLRFVETAGGLLLVYGIGASLGALAASAMMALQGRGGLFAFTTCVHLALAVFAVVRLRLSPRPAEEDRSDFVAVPRTSPTLYELDPRSEAEPEDGGPSAGAA